MNPSWNVGHVEGSGITCSARFLPSALAIWLKLGSAARLPIACRPCCFEVAERVGAAAQPVARQRGEAPEAAMLEAELELWGWVEVEPVDRIENAHTHPIWRAMW